MKKLLLAASILLGSHGAASAFTADDANIDYFGSFGYEAFGQCQIEMKLAQTGEEALVRVRYDSIDWLPARFLFIEGRVSNGSELTADIVEQCLGTEVTDFTTVASTGSFATQTHMGFSFNVEDVEFSASPIGGVAPVDGTYTFHIGTAPVPDETPPTVTLTSNAGDPHSAGFTVTATFSEAVNDFSLRDVAATNGGIRVASFAMSTDRTTATFDVDPLLLNGRVSIIAGAESFSDDAGNVNTANSTLSVIISQAAPTEAGSPASYFEENEDAIREVIVGDALRSLRSNVATNKRLVQGTLSRFESGGDTVEFDVDGSLKATSSSAETNGTFFGQTASEDGTALRIVSGDFDLQRDAETGSSTATINGRVAWEAMQSEATLLGYYVGGELAYSNLDDTFSGNQTRVGVNVGGYVVQALGEGVFASGFASFGLGSNNLGISDEVIVLESDYITRTATIGGSLTGTYESEGYELRPELAFSYGQTWIGDVGFTGVAYGLTDTELSLDAGNVILANLTFRPEVILTGGADNGAKFSFAPRFICESRETSTRVSNCGMGAEFGIMHKSEDELSSTNLRVVRDRVGGGTQTSAMFNLQRKF